MIVPLTIIMRQPRIIISGLGIFLPILPIFIPALARARSADCAPGPGVFVLQQQILNEVVHG